MSTSEHDAQELSYGPLIEDEWADESNRKKRPKWMSPNAPMMKYMAPFRRKWFKTREERSKCKRLLSLLQTEMITTEWVENVLSWALRPAGNNQWQTQWSFGGFLNAAIDVENYRDWQIRVDNAKRHGEDASFDPTDMEHLQTKYGAKNR